MIKKQKKVCLITPGHIATNPRLVKEAISLQSEGYQVHIVFTQYMEYLVHEDFAILKEHPGWNYDVLNWVGNSFSTKVTRFRAGIIQKFSLKIVNAFSVPLFNHLVLNRNLFWQIRKAVTTKADLYIGHNLGALPVARIAARKNSARSGFDAEDYHRHEVVDNPGDADVIRKSRIEANYIPGLDHFTVASPLIGKEYTQLFPALNPVPVLNTFPKTNIVVGNEPGNRLKLFWFSQTIGSNRGLEDIIKAMGNCDKDSFELHLLGKCTGDIKQVLMNIATNAGVDSKLICYHEPVPEKEIFSIAAGCDIGLASETGIPYNREICLTNKIFTYVQSGLAVLASDTKAQCYLLETHRNIGKVYKKNNVESLAAALNFYNQNRNELYDCKRNNFSLGQTKLNWETEQSVFLSSVERALN